MQININKYDLVVIRELIEDKIRKNCDDLEKPFLIKLQKKLTKAITEAFGNSLS